MKGDSINLIEFLKRIPSIEEHISAGVYDDGNWWIKFKIDIKHDLAWNVVQELGHIINYVSIEQPLPTSFYPVSPPPYMNGAPSDFLSWIIESRNKEFAPDDMLEWLEGRLPRPVDDLANWEVENEE